MEAMPAIILLPDDVVNEIAAGEVVSHPFNAVKEMLENSLDAGAKRISVTIEQGGLGMMVVEDDGKGISKQDMPLVCWRHATSKLRKFEDLKEMSTYGFRGEAMASISQVASVSVISRTVEDTVAHRASYKDGKIIGDELHQAAFAYEHGTTVIVKDLFYNYTQRLESLKPSTEASSIVDLISKYAVHRPDVKFTYTSRGGARSKKGTPFETTGDGNQHSVILKMFGKKDIFDLKGGNEDLHYRFAAAFTIEQLLTANSIHAKHEDRKLFILFINGRLVRCDSMKRFIDAAFKTQKKIFLFMLLSLEIENNFIDVNVSPTKEEVHFLMEKSIAHQISERFAEYLIQSSKQQNVSSKVQTILSPMFIKPEQTTTTGGKRSQNALDSNGRTNSKKSGIAHSAAAIGVLSDRVTSKARRNDPSRMMVSHGERKIEEFLPANKPLNSAAKPLLQRRVVRVGETPSDSLHMQDQNSGNADPVSQRLSLAPRKLQFDSVKKLREEICSNRDGHLHKLFENFHFIGFSDSSRRAFFQSDTTCYRFDTVPIMREFFYQLVVFGFGDLPSYELKAGREGALISLRRLLGLHFTAKQQKPGLSDYGEKVDNCVRVLVSASEMLWDYFSIGIGGGLDAEPTLTAIPSLVGNPQPFIPLLTKLPRLVYDLSMVDYEHEEECFRGIARALADFYVPVEVAEENEKTVKVIEDTLEDEEITNSMQDSRKREHLQVLKHHMRYMIFPHLRRQFIPPKSLSRSLSQVINTRAACKLFGRC